MKILLRYDDFSETSNVDVDMAVLETITAEGFNPLVGVIPAVADVNWELGRSIPLRKLSPERIKLLKKMISRGIEIALHGYTHQAVARWSGLFEFGDAVDFKRQVERLHDGKHFLEDSFGVAVDWFIPPWNAYGVTTLQALKKCGFRGVSADASFGHINEGLCYAPATCLPREIPLILATRMKKDIQRDVVVVMHDYDFQESGIADKAISISDLKRMLNKIKQKNIISSSFSELLYNGNWDKSRAVVNQKLRQYTTGPIRLLLQPGFTTVYWDEPTANQKLAFLNRWSYLLKKILNGYRKILSFIRR